MRTRVNSSGTAGSVVRRVREDAGLSRSALAAAAEVSPRTLFAFEQGCNDNIGLASFIRMLDALDLTLSVDDGKGGPARAGAAPAPGTPAMYASASDALAPDATAPDAPAPDAPVFHGKWEELGERWRLDGEGR